jgi:replicative DNA helicase
VIALDAERALLGCLLLGEWDDDLSSDLFAQSSHVRLFRHIAALQAGGIEPDIATVTSRILQVGGNEAAACAGLEYVQALPERVPTSASWMHYAKQCRDAATRRRIKAAAAELDAATSDPDRPVEDILDAAERALARLAPTTKGLADAEASGERAWVELEDRMQGFRDGRPPGLPMGLRDLTEILAPSMRPGSQIIIAARPSQGKSILAMQAATAIAAKGRGVVVFCLEMSVEQLTHRAWAAHSSVPLDRFSEGDPNITEIASIEDAHGAWVQLPIYISDDAGQTMASLKSATRKAAQVFARQGTPLGAVVLDYLQLMTTGSGRSRTEEVGKISRGMKRLAMELGIVSIVLSQLSRKVEERRPPRPMLSDLRDSGEIEQDADAVVFLYRDGYYRPDMDDSELWTTELIVAKQRNGKTGTVKAQLQGQFARFVALERRYA